MTATTILPDSEDDWDVSRAWAWSCWSRDFSDVTEIGPSSYDFIRIWQNDPSEIPKTRPARPPDSLAVRWARELSSQITLKKLRDTDERDLLPGHVVLLVAMKPDEEPTEPEKIPLTSSGGGSPFGRILDFLSIDRNFRSTLYKSLPDYHDYEFNDGFCYQLKFPNLYRGEFALAAWFKGQFEDLPQYPHTGQMNALVLGLSEAQLSDIFVKLTRAESTVLKTQNAAPSIVIHPFMLIAAILDRFSEEDGMFINKSIDNLKVLQQKISTNVALSMGNLSIELNQLSSDLRAIQMGNVYMQSLARVILASSCTVNFDNGSKNQSLRDLVEGMEYSSGKQPWSPLLGQFTHIISDLEALQTRCEDRKFDIECLQKQIDINLNVAYNLLSQEENRWNRTISQQMAADSRAMHHIAIASKDIAEASKRDSYAMKTIAILTTIFLPGTFVASLFSTTMFNFQASPVQVSSAFWIYWAVTVPLTLVVVGVWRLWLYLRHRHLQLETALGVDEEKTIKGD